MCHVFLHISSALIVLKNVSITALKLLYLPTRFFQCFWPAKMRKDFTNNIAFQTANDLAFAFAVFGTFSNIREGIHARLAAS